MVNFTTHDTIHYTTVFKERAKTYEMAPEYNGCTYKKSYTAL